MIAIIAILASMLLPALSRARAVARRAACLSNQRQLALSSLTYADNYGGWMLKSKAYTTELGLDTRETPAPVFSSLSVLVCPSTTNRSPEPRANYARLGVFFSNNNRTGTSYRWMSGTRGSEDDRFLTSKYYRHWVNFYAMPSDSSTGTVAPAPNINMLGRALTDPENGKRGYSRPPDGQAILFDAYSPDRDYWIGFNTECLWSNSHCKPNGMSDGYNIVFFDGHAHWQRIGEGTPRIPAQYAGSNATWIYW